MTKARRLIQVSYDISDAKGLNRIFASQDWSKSEEPYKFNRADAYPKGEYA